MRFGVAEDQGDDDRSATLLPPLGARGRDADFASGSSGGAHLVIGYGNLLRRDDAAGYLAAESLAGRSPASIRAIAVAQLTPELAAELALARAACFVDARLGGAAGGLLVEEIFPDEAGSTPLLAHSLSPGGLMQLCGWLYGRVPRCWLVSIPGVDFELGLGLSPLARAGLAEAVRAIDRWSRSLEVIDLDRDGRI